MKESDIKAHVSAGATRKKSGVHSTSKSRTALVQEGENGVEIPTLNAAPSESVVSCKEPIQLGSISNILGKNVAMTKDTLAAKKVSKITVIKKPVEITPKPRTALFQGGEDDEPMAPQASAIIFRKNSNVSNISIPIELLKNNLEDHSYMKLGDFYIDLNRVKEVKNSKVGLTFMGNNLLKKLEDKMKWKPSIIQFGSMPATELT
jgi:hypothetical protein